MKLLIAALLMYLSLIPPVEGQEGSHMARVGFLSPGAASASAAGEAFRKALGDLGYVEGKNLVIERRFAEGKYERFPELAADLAAQKVDVIFLIGAVTARATKKVVSNIPIVFAVVVDPVTDGVVSSMERPGNNITGLMTFDPQQSSKQLQLLREAIPSVRRVAILDDQGVSEFLINNTEDQARSLGLETRRYRIAASNPDFDAAFGAMRQDHVDAVLIQEVPLLSFHQKEIAELATKNGLPSMFPPLFGRAGGLLAYGVSLTKVMPRAAAYVDRILKGANAGEIPVERAIPYELIVNQRTARDLGVTIPADIVKRADTVIE